MAPGPPYLSNSLHHFPLSVSLSLPLPRTLPLPLFLSTSLLLFHSSFLPLLFLSPSLPLFLPPPRPFFLPFPLPPPFPSTPLPDSPSRLPSPTISTSRYLPKKPNPGSASSLLPWRPCHPLRTCRAPHLRHFAETLLILLVKASCRAPFRRPLPATAHATRTTHCARSRKRWWESWCPSGGCGCCGGARCGSSSCANW